MRLNFLTKNFINNSANTAIFINLDVQFFRNYTQCIFILIAQVFTGVFFNGIEHRRSFPWRCKINLMIT